MENESLTDEIEDDNMSKGQPTFQIKDFKNQLEKQQKLTRLIQKCFKLSKYYRHLESIFHKGENKES